ncbi:MAG TPA: Gfo/Idh/MocA family oxidoreductase [Acidobacteriaceae bacterium]
MDQTGKTIRAGVVGFGLAGRIFHAAVINQTPGMEVASIVQRSGDEAAEAYPRAKVARSVDEMLEDPSITLCVVATPNKAHRGLAEQCLRAGRHVVVDKPLALSSEDATAMARLAAERGLILAPYHNRRWDGDYQTVRMLLEEGRLGRPLHLVSHFDRYRLEPRLEAWRESGEPGGGILFDLGPHLIDQALALFGTPTTLWADVRRSREQAAVDDAFDIALSYDAPPGAPPARYQGLRVWLCATLAAASAGARFTLHGALGSYEKWGLDPQEDALKRGDSFETPGFGVEAAHAWGVLTLPGKPPEPVPTLPGDYRGYYANVRDAILGRAALQVTVRDAWCVARLIELARQSSEQGCKLPVDFSEAP